MAKQRKAVESCAGRVSRVLKLLRSAENVPDSRPSKAAAKVLRVLRVLRGAENVLDSSFEAQ